MHLELALPRRALKTLAVIGGLSFLSLGLVVTPAAAAPVCTGDVCVIPPDTVQTPLGLVTVTISASDVATVVLAPTSRTVVFGVTGSVPPGPPGLPGYTRTSLSTSAGLINIDTIVVPPGPPARFSLPNIAVISIIPPGPPCRATTSGMTVVFTPMIPPGPPAQPQRAPRTPTSSSARGPCEGRSRPDPGMLTGPIP